MYELKKQDNHDIAAKKNNNIRINYLELINLFDYSKASNSKFNVGTVLYLNLQLTTKSFQLSTTY